MKRLSKAFLIFSSLLYTAFLFYVYAYFAEQSIIYLQLFEETVSFSNNTLFYAGIIVPMVIVLLLFLLSNIIYKQPIGKTSFIKNEDTKIRLSSWSLSIGGVINFFFASILSVILFANNEEGLIQNGYLPLVLACLVLVTIWIIWLPVILLKNK